MSRITPFAAIVLGVLALGAPGASAASLGDPSGVAAASAPGVETVQFGYGYGYGPRYRPYGYGRPRPYYGRPAYGPRPYGPRRFYGPRPGYRPGPYGRDYR